MTILKHSTTAHYIESMGRHTGTHRWEICDRGQGLSQRLRAQKSYQVNGQMSIKTSDPQSKSQFIHNANSHSQFIHKVNALSLYAFTH